MNSPKHLPTIVFFMGLFMLSYSMYVFFRAPKQNVQAQLEKPPAFLQPQEVKTPVAPKIFQAIKLNRAKEPSDTFAEDLKKMARKPAEKYLQYVGLEMNLPADTRYYESKDGPMKILTGSFTPGKDSFYIFSIKRKYTTENAAKYLKKYFEDQMQFKIKDPPQTYFNKGGLENMTLAKGTTNTGDEFQTYVFRNPKTKISHVVFLTEKQLSRQPARNRALIDSITAQKTASLK